MIRYLNWNKPEEVRPLVTGSPRCAGLCVSRSLKQSQWLRRFLSPPVHMTIPGPRLTETAIWTWMEAAVVL